MPRSAIATGMVDWVLPVADMPARLIAVPRDSSAAAAAARGRPAAAEAPARRPTMHRGRAARGAALPAQRAPAATSPTTSGRPSCAASRGGCRSTASPTCRPTSSCLRTRPGEAGALLQDLLISVTNFFRDPELLRGARGAACPSCSTTRAPSDAVRVWVPACATRRGGLLDRDPARRARATRWTRRRRCRSSPPTSTSRRSRPRATAVYPATIEADVTPSACARFFVTRAPRLPRAPRDARDRCCSRVHDLLKDSPFSRLDLVSCRNLLIYLNRDAQARGAGHLPFRAACPKASCSWAPRKASKTTARCSRSSTRSTASSRQRPAPRTSCPCLPGPDTLGAGLDDRPHRCGRPRRCVRRRPRSSLAAVAGAGSRARRRRGARPRRGASCTTSCSSAGTALDPGRRRARHRAPVARAPAASCSSAGGEPSRNLLRLIRPGPAHRAARGAVPGASRPGHPARGRPGRRRPRRRRPAPSTIRVAPGGEAGARLLRWWSSTRGSHRTRRAGRATAARRIAADPVARAPRPRARAAEGAPARHGRAVRGLDRGAEGQQRRAAGDERGAALGHRGARDQPRGAAVDQRGADHRQPRAEEQGRRAGQREQRHAEPDGRDGDRRPCSSIASCASPATRRRR